VDEKPVSVSRKNTSNWLRIRALTLTLAPLVIILGLGFCQTQKPDGILKPEPSLTAGAAAQGHDQVVVFVKDNGVGFNMQYLNKLFCVMQCLTRKRLSSRKGLGGELQAWRQCTREEALRRK